MSNIHSVTTTRFELKQLFQLMIPILVTQFAQAGLGLIDTIMAGHMSATDLAAIAVGVGLWMPIMLLFSGIMIATTPLVAKAKGARTPEKNCNHRPSVFMDCVYFRCDCRADFTAHACTIAIIWCA